MCNCIDEINEKLRPYNTRLVTTHRITDGALIGTMEIRTEKIVNYRDAKLPMLVTPAFCPNCGEKIARDGLRDVHEAMRADEVTR